MSNVIHPLPAAKALDNFFFEARAKILDLGAFLDRIERGENAAERYRSRQRGSRPTELARQWLNEHRQGRNRWSLACKARAAQAGQHDPAVVNGQRCGDCSRQCLPDRSSVLRITHGRDGAPPSHL